jgi:sec-independent protein translocase protein TatA
MPSVGPMELIVVLAIALIVLGPKRLPEAGKSLGKGIREFKDSMTGDTGEPKKIESAKTPE